MGQVSPAVPLQQLRLQDRFDSTHSSVLLASAILPCRMTLSATMSVPGFDIMRAFSK